MNEFHEFCKAWKLEFPGQDLPTVWEEDTRANLLRHKKNLDYLKSEIRKEEFYVKFLESILSNAESRKQQTSSQISENVAGVLSTADHDCLAITKTVADPQKTDFVTVISITNKLENFQDLPKPIVERPKAPPKPIKHYARSISSDSPNKPKPEDLIAWTKQQIQQLQTKQTLKHGESASGPSPSPPTIPPLPLMKQNYENVTEPGSKKRISYENVKQPKSDYENVLNDFSLTR